MTDGATGRVRQDVARCRPALSGERHDSEVARPSRLPHSPQRHAAPECLLTHRAYGSLQLRAIDSVLTRSRPRVRIEHLVLWFFVITPQLDKLIRGTIGDPASPQATAASMGIHAGLESLAW